MPYLLTDVAGELDKLTAQSVNQPEQQPQQQSEQQPEQQPQQQPPSQTQEAEQNEVSPSNTDEKQKPNVRFQLLKHFEYQT